MAIPSEYQDAPEIFKDVKATVLRLELFPDRFEIIIGIT